MKKITLLLLFISVIANAQWQNVGTPAFTAGKALYTSLVVDEGGTPYVAYRDDANGKKASVMKYNGTSWVYVGAPGFSADEANYLSLAIDAGGALYLAYQDVGNNYRATVKKFNGTSWDTVGTVGFSGFTANYTSLALDSNGTPYVAFMDSGANAKASVMKFNGISWDYVGSAGVSAGSVYFTSIAFDTADNLYLTFTDVGTNNTNRGTVLKYNGSSWTAVGSAEFTPSSATYNRMAVDSSGTPHIAFLDGANGGRATVMKYNGSSWVAVGTPGFSAGTASEMSLVFDGSGTPYLSFVDNGADFKSRVMKFDGTAWVNVGTPGLSSYTASFTSLAFDPAGSLYLAFGDAGNEGKATVMTFPPAADGAVHLNDAACNSTAASFTKPLYSNTVPGVQSYRFRVKSGGQEEIINRSVPYFSLNMLQSPAYGTIYTVDVSVLTEGQWSAYGEACTVTTIPSPLSQLELCTEGGTAVSGFAAPVYTTGVPQATNYRFRVTSLAGTTTLDRPTRYFMLNMIPSYDYNVDYSVEVASFTGGSWSAYGEPCVVYVDLPAAGVALRAPYCNGTVSKRGQAIYATHYPGGVTWHFRVAVGASQYTVVRNVGYFFLSQLPVSVPFGTTVGVEVKVFTAGTESAWGASCPVTLINQTGRPGNGDDADADETVTETVTVLKGFPNPFTNTFAIDFATESDEQVHIVVYDMTGKLVDRRSASVTELLNLRIGDNFTTGIYNLILTQGETVKTLRVMKN
ncbi:MAG: T9SS type A sorting domain-containing protein [Flavobacterium sp.]